MRVLDLFSGIGGFSLAANWAGFETIAFVEQDNYCQKLLRKNFGPNIKIHGDIREFTGFPGSADIVCGGPPCQPFSKAGKKRGKNDNRHLWPEMFRVIREVQPFAAVVENVFGFIKMALDEVINDLEGEGYSCQAFVIPAYAVGAFHNRDRVWIIAIKGNAHDTNANGIRSYRKEEHKQRETKFQHEQIRLPGPLVSPSVRDGTNPRIFRDSNGLSNRVDRIRGLGNAIVPQIALQIFQFIKQVDLRF